MRVRKTIKVDPKTGGKVALYLGILMLVGAMYMFVDTLSFVDQASHAEGTVVELAEEIRKSHSGRSGHKSTSVSYAPVVTFQTAGGFEIKFTSSTSSNPSSFSVGEKVEVLFSEDNPQNATLNTFFSLWGAVIILACLGAVFSFVGMHGFRCERDSKEPEYFQIH